jgi:serine protease AprX
MGPFLKFNGKMYSELKPLYRGKYANRYTMPKGLPALQKPIPIHNITSDTLTEEQTMLDSVRKHHPELTGKGISVVIIDSGIFEHQMLRRNIKLRLSTNGNESDVNDNYGHGTHMAGIIAAKDSKISCIGIAPDAEIISIKVTNEKSGSATWKSIYLALQKVHQLLDEGTGSNAKIGVVNISFNGLDAQVNKSKFGKHRIFESIRKLKERNIPVVVSAGNAFEFVKEDGLGYPAFHPDVIAAGAHFNYQFKNLPTNAIATFSQRYRSPFLHDVLGMFKGVNEKLIFAPGACSVSLNNSNDPDAVYSITSGTSVSAAILSGAIILMQQKWMMNTKQLMPLEKLKDALHDGCDVFQNVGPLNPVTNEFAPANRSYDKMRYTRLNIYKSLNLI